jgi:hypothetical protein
MDAKFINQYTITFDMYRDWAKHPVGQAAIRSRRKNLVLCIGGIVVSVGLAVFGAVMSQFYVVLMGAVFFIIFGLRLFFIPQQLLRKKYAMILKSLNGAQWTRTITFADKITVEDGRNSGSYDYSEFKALTEDEQYFFLFLNNDMALRVRKDSFTEGTAERFGKQMRKAIKRK